MNCCTAVGYIETTLVIHWLTPLKYQVDSTLQPSSGADPGP